MEVEVGILLAHCWNQYPGRWNQHLMLQSHNGCHVQCVLHLLWVSFLVERHVFPQPVLQCCLQLLGVPFSQKPKKAILTCTKNVVLQGPVDVPELANSLASLACGPYTRVLD